MLLHIWSNINYCCHFKWCSILCNAHLWDTLSCNKPVYLAKLFSVGEAFCDWNKLCISVLCVHCILSESLISYHCNIFIFEKKVDQEKELTMGSDSSSYRRMRNHTWKPITCSQRVTPNFLSFTQQFKLWHIFYFDREPPLPQKKPTMISNQRTDINGATLLER